MGNAYVPDNVYICFFVKLLSFCFGCTWHVDLVHQPAINPHGLNHSLTHQGHPCLYLLLYLIYMVKEKGAYICESLEPQFCLSLLFLLSTYTI